MKRQLPFELIYQAAALVLAVILVHLVYVTVIRPNADAIIAAQAERAAAGEAYAAVDKICWDGVYLRRDIGHRAIARENA